MDARPDRTPRILIAPCAEWPGGPCYLVRAGSLRYWIGPATGPAASLHLDYARQLAGWLRLEQARRRGIVKRTSARSRTQGTRVRMRTGG